MQRPNKNRGRRPRRPDDQGISRSGSLVVWVVCSGVGAAFKHLFTLRFTRAWKPEAPREQKKTIMLLRTLLLVQSVTGAPIIGGWGAYRYEYKPDRLVPPAGSVMVNCHGLVVDVDHNIYLTYENDHKLDPDRCLIRWKPDGTGGEHMLGGNSTLCSGTPHGLTIATEWDSLAMKEQQFLYHANNDAKLTKTTLDGTILWQTEGNFGQDPHVPYKPTWFAVPPLPSEYVYLCDGYGSNHVYVFDRQHGVFQNQTFGGRGGRDQHGKFSTNHGCLYDPRSGQIAVSDRANSRVEYFEFSPHAPDHFQYRRTSDLRPAMGKASLPCNLRVETDLQAMAVSPDLSGPVAILNASNAVVSVVNVSVLLAAQEHKHPHDAILLPNGDLIVATWDPGRLSYWERLP